MGLSEERGGGSWAGRVAAEGGGAKCSCQNSYTRELTISELFRGLQLQLFGITVTFSLFFLQSAVTENNSPQVFSRPGLNL